MELSKLEKYKKLIMKKFLIFQEMDLCSPKLKKFLKFFLKKISHISGETCNAWKKNSYISLKKFSYISE